MTIFLKLPKITGSATAKGFEGAIELTSLDWHSERKIKLREGVANNRDISIPSQQELILNKFSDAASCELHQSYFKASIFDTATISMCHSNLDNGVMLVYTLHNVMISRVEEHLDRTHALPQERLFLNYTKLEKKYSFSNEQGKLMTPKSVQYDFAEMC